MSSLSLIKPFKASYRISFDVGSAINAGTTELLEISLMHGLFEVSERYHGINGETLLPNNAYSFNFDVDMYYENEGWGVIDTVKLRVGTDDFGFSALTLSVKLENNGYKQLLHLQHADVVIAEGKWYQNFEPYCIFEGGSGALFSHLQVTRPEQYEKLELKTNYSVSIWVKVKSQNAPLQNQNSCKVFNPPASRRSSNSVGSTCSPSGLLDGSSSDSWRSSWCASDNSNNTAYLQLDAGKTTSIGGAVVQGGGEFNEYVTRLKFKVSVDGINWIDVDDGMIFDGNDNSFASTWIVYSKVYRARYLRYIPTSYFTRKSMRAAILICDEKCSQSFYNPPANQRKYNGVRSDCGLGIFGGIPWCAANNNLNASNEYLQIDSGQFSKISGVRIQGAENSNQWVTALKFNVSNDTDTWIYVDNGESFAGNVNADDIVNISFAHAIVARFIRFIPVSFYSWPSMSVGLELCIPFQTWQQNTYKNKNI